MQGIYDKIEKAVKASKFDALIVTGADNFNYMAGAAIPFLTLYPDKPVSVTWPKDGEPTVVAPADWEDSVRSLSSIKRIKSYQIDEKDYAKAVVESLKGVRKKGRIGIDFLRVSQHRLEILKKALYGHEIAACDDEIRELRSTKTIEELNILEEIAYKVDHGIFGAQHHVLVTSIRTEMSLAEEIRIHCLERGLDVVGSHSLSQDASGENAKKWWPRAPFYGIGHEKKLQLGEFVRMEARYSLDGYWGVGCRLMTMGYPTAEQRKAYNHLIALRDRAIEAIKPGVKCSDVYKLMKVEAKKREAKLVEGIALGHGVGVADMEAPYISGYDDTVICPDMALVIRPVIEGLNGELLWSSDTVFVESDCTRIVGWYKDWREPYVANYTL